MRLIMQDLSKLRFPGLSFLMLAAFFGCAQAPQFQEEANWEVGDESEGTEGAMAVYKNSFCFCCKRWMKHLKENSFNVVNDNSQTIVEVKKKWGVPYAMQGCHTGILNNNYVFEGHVPARLIRKFLSNPPANSIGLAVPGMPALSPGMYKENKSQNEENTPYSVYLILADGQYKFYEAVSQPE